MLRVHVDEAADAELSTTLGELVAEGARRILAAAIEAVVDAYVTALADEREARATAWWCATACQCPVTGHRSGTHRGPDPTGG
jgi:hypothetical protein